MLRYRNITINFPCKISTLLILGFIFVKPFWPRGGNHYNLLQMRYAVKARDNLVAEHWRSMVEHMFFKVLGQGTSRLLGGR